MIGWSTKTKLIKYKKKLKKGWPGDQVGKSCKDRDGPTLYWGSWAWRTGQSNHFQIIIKKITFSVDQLLWAARQSDRVLGTSERMWLWREQRGKGLNLKIKLKYSVVLVSPITFLSLKSIYYDFQSSGESCKGSRDREGSERGLQGGQSWGDCKASCSGSFLSINY